MKKVVSSENIDSNTVFCINCGEEIPAETEFCPECGAGQDPSELSVDKSSTSAEHSGFTSWVVGFEPGNTLRNITVGFLYIIFLSVGIVLLVYSYLAENPNYVKYAEYYAALSIMLVGLSGFAGGSILSGAAVIIVIGIGALFIPQVREKLNIESVPGVDDTNTIRKNLAIGFIYYFAASITVTFIIGAGVAA